MVVSFSMFPIGKGESLSAEIAKVIKLVKASGLPYQLGPMSTTIEGEWDEIFALLNTCRKTLRQESGRVYITIKVDDRAGGMDQLTKKVKSVEEKL